MSLRKQVSDLHADVRKLAALLEKHPTSADLKKVHDEVKSARDDVAGVASATQASLTAVTQNLGAVLARAAELAGTPAPAPAPAPSARKTNAAKTTAADPSTPGKETT